MNINRCFEYLNTPLPTDITLAVACGDWERADHLIENELLKDNIPDSLRYALTARKEMINRLPGQYPYSRSEAMDIIKQHVPDFTEDEFDKYVNDRIISWIYSHGEQRFFGRFFGTMCKTDPAFAQRAAASLPGSESAVTDSRNNNLNTSMRMVKENGSVCHKITVKATLKISDDIFRPGCTVRAWLPVPKNCDSQSEIEIISMSPAGGYISSPDAPQRTIYWEEKPESNHSYEVVYSYKSSIKYNDTDKMTAPSAEQPNFYTSEKAPHIVFTPLIKELAEALSADCNGPIEKARAFYDYITLNKRYTFMPDYFNVDSIAEYCALNGTGDCGVLALLFITLCRSVGIPAVWESGLAVEPGFIGAHDWARFYAEPYGWLYADPSFGTGAVRVNNEERRRYYFGNRDAFRMVANSDFQSDFDPPSAGWRIDPYDNQLGELELDGIGLQDGEVSRVKSIVDFQTYI